MNRFAQTDKRREKEKYRLAAEKLNFKKKKH